MTECKIPDQGMRPDIGETAMVRHKNDPGATITLGEPN